MRRRRNLLIFLAGLAAALATGLGALVYLSLRHLRPPRFWPREALPEDDFQPVDVSFPSSDGVLLHGWFLPATGAADLIVLCHGYAMSRLETQELAQALNARGHHVLLFDFRAHGRSEGRFTSLGYHEVHDLLGAVAYLKTRPEYTPGRLGVLGLSMGAVTAILAAARCPAIAAVVADSSFAALDHIVAQGVQQTLRLPITALARCVVRLGELAIGLRAAAVRPLDAVAQIAPRPLLIIHGGADRLVPVAEAQALYAAAGEPRELWTVPGADHVQGRFVAPEAYLARVDEFFGSHLCRPLS